VRVGVIALGRLKGKSGDHYCIDLSESLKKELRVVQGFGKCERYQCRRDMISTTQESLLHGIHRLERVQSA